MVLMKGLDFCLSCRQSLMKLLHLAFLINFQDQAISQTSLIYLPILLPWEGFWQVLLSSKPGKLLLLLVLGLRLPRSIVLEYASKDLFLLELFQTNELLMRQGFPSSVWLLLSLLGNFLTNISLELTYSEQSLAFERLKLCPLDAMHWYLPILSSESLGEVFFQNENLLYFTFKLIGFSCEFQPVCFQIDFPSLDERFPSHAVMSSRPGTLTRFISISESRLRLDWASISRLELRVLVGFLFLNKFSFPQTPGPFDQ